MLREKFLDKTKSKIKPIRNNSKKLRYISRTKLQVLDGSSIQGGQIKARKISMYSSL